jgi:hypothetical protein
VLAKLVTGSKNWDWIIALGPIAEGCGAAACRLFQTWSLSRRLARVHALPYPPPKKSQFISANFDHAVSFSSALALRLAFAAASLSRGVI